MATILTKLSSMANEIIGVGDFNFSKFEWKYSNDTPGYLIATNYSVDSTHKYFCETITNAILHQINDVHNSRNVIIDLEMVTHYEGKHIRIPLTNKLLDKISLHHQPFIIEFSMTSTKDNVPEHFNFNRIDFEKAKSQLATIYHPRFIQEDIDFHNGIDATVFPEKVNKYIQKLSHIQSICTKKEAKYRSSEYSNHPWLRNSKSFANLQREARKALNIYRITHDDTDKLAYQQASKLKGQLYDDSSLMS